MLGVAPDATAAQIRTAYLRHARDHHPDRHLASRPAVRADHERAMREVNAAWAVLGHAGRRRRYDEERSRRTAEDTPRGAARGSTARERRWAEEDAAKAAWRPFDDSPDPLDPRLLADEPPAEAPGRGPALSFRFFVKLCFGLGAGFFLGGALGGAATVSGAGIVMMVLAAAFLLALPLLALGRSASNDRAADARRVGTGAPRPRGSRR